LWLDNSARSATERAQGIVTRNDFSAFHVIQAGDVQEQFVLFKGDAFTLTEDVIGHYLLQEVAADTTLRPEHISAIGAEDLRDRQLISLPMKEGAIIDTLVPSNTISLILAPRAGCCDPPLEPLILNDAIIWVVDWRDNAVSIVVAVKGPDCQSVVNRYLAVSDVFMMESGRDLLGKSQPTATLSPTPMFANCLSAFKSITTIGDPAAPTSTPTRIPSPLSSPTNTEPTSVTPAAGGAPSPGTSAAMPVLPRTSETAVPRPYVGIVGAALVGIGVLLVALSLLRNRPQR
jgi:hypothetical protein